jgi:RimJ/RimL family protein N-acetyltransferase
MNIHSLKTDRLLLEPLTTAYNNFIFELVNTDGWIKFIGNRNVNSAVDATAYIEKIINNPALVYWVIKLKENGTPIGIITLIKRDYLEHHDIGFALLPDFEKQGYAYEACKKVLDALSEGSLHTQILAITLRDNSNSITLLGKLGLRFEKEIVEQEELLLQYVLQFPANEAKQDADRISSNR